LESDQTLLGSSAVDEGGWNVLHCVAVDSYHVSYAGQPPLCFPAAAVGAIADFSRRPKVCVAQLQGDTSEGMSLHLPI
jgi:hypothetical protein